MSSLSAPSTPNHITATPTFVSNAPTGTWKHPQFDEIQRRTNASTFSDRNVRAIVSNAFILMASLFLPSQEFLQSLHPTLNDIVNAAAPYTSYSTLIIRILPLLGILYACSPLLFKKDDLTDIPLTPTQRSLLGLEPSSQPATPGSHYITPPRYARSTTPKGHSTSGSLTGSPFSGVDSFGSGTPGAGGGRFSPSPSPLLHKATQRDIGRRLSLGNMSHSGLGRSFTDATTALALSPNSPSAGRGASVGLSNRWLFEKQRTSSGLRSIYS